MQAPSHALGMLVRRRILVLRGIGEVSPVIVVCKQVTVGFDRERLEQGLHPISSPLAGEDKGGGYLTPPPDLPPQGEKASEEGWR